MIYGLKSMEIVLEKQVFFIGQEVNGTIKINAREKSPEAELSVRLVGVEKIKQSIQRSMKTSMNYLFNQEKSLGFHEVVDGDEYSFSFQLPENVLERTSAGDIGSASAKVASSRSEHEGYSSRRIDWYLKAKLETEDGKKIQKKEIKVK